MLKYRKVIQIDRLFELMKGHRKKEVWKSEKQKSFSLQASKHERTLLWSKLQKLDFILKKHNKTWIRLFKCMTF